MKKILIATPMYGGNCKGIYVDGILNLVGALQGSGYQVMYSKIFNESLITRARNTLAHEFLKSDAEYMLFIDADHGFNAADIIRMIESGKDLIGAVYPMKNINWDMVIKAYENGHSDLDSYSGFFSANLLTGKQTITLNEPMEVENVATGMMLISRKVYEAMIPDCEMYGNHGNTGAIDMNDKVYDFFKTEIDERGVLLSEDYYFCKKWKELGGTVYAAPWVSITHAGDYTFSGNFAKTLVLRSQLGL
jgi:hypothetical protein